MIMSRSLCLCLLAVLGLAFAFGAANAELPHPKEYPTSWELKFDHGKPVRIAVEVPGQPTKQGFWYIPFTATNNTGQERMFLPVVEMATEDGRIVRSDNNIPDAVVQKIRKLEGNKFIGSSVNISGDFRLGNDECKYGVAVWREPTLEMGRFSILFGGLCGEYTRVKGDDGKEVTLRKTLQLNFLVHGDNVYPGEDLVNSKPELWIMR